MATSVSTDTAPISLRRRLAVSAGWRRDARAGRTPLWGEAIVIAWLCWLYDILTNLAPARRALALAHAAAALRLERALGIDPELSLDRWLTGDHTLALVLSDYYDNAHFVVTLGLLGLLWWRRCDLYPSLRNALVLTNVIAFAVFWLWPLAPPRMLAGSGFSDVVATSGAIGSWHAGSLAAYADQYAAMPSLHVAWAAWCLVVVWKLTRRRWLLALGALHVAVTAFVVLCTGNHFLLDVLAGAATATVAFAAPKIVRGMRAAVAPLTAAVARLRADGRGSANLALRSRYRMSQTCHEVSRSVDSAPAAADLPID